MEKSKIIANRGVSRNKKPLKNIVYTFEITTLKEHIDPELYKQYKFKDLGYIVMYWKYEGDKQIGNWHGFVTPAELKELVGNEQYRKFCEGKREFIIQRRFNGLNIPKKK